MSSRSNRLNAPIGFTKGQAYRVGIRKARGVPACRRDGKGECKRTCCCTSGKVRPFVYRNQLVMVQR